MLQNSDVLDSYGTGPRGKLGNEGPSTTVQVDTHVDVSMGNQEVTEAKIRARAYDRYKDCEVRSDQHFKFYKRLVPLSRIHVRKEEQTAPIAKKSTDDLVKLICKEGWSKHLGSVIVSDDSIIPPDGPGTRLRSHLLQPCFSLVDGERRVGALKEASKGDSTIPEEIIVEVAVPLEGTSLGEAEVRLLEMAIRLNHFRSGGEGRDFHRIVNLRSWLKEKPEFAHFTSSNLAGSDITRITKKAIKDGAIGKENLSATHLRRYIRVAFIFEQSPAAFEVYYRSIKSGETKAQWWPIVSLSYDVMFKAESTVRVLLIECIRAHLKAKQSPFRRNMDVVFIANIMEVYKDVEMAAQGLGYDGTSFLGTVVLLPSVGNSAKGTVWQAITATAKSTCMSTPGLDVKTISARMRKALCAAKGVPVPPTTDYEVPTTVRKTMRSLLRNPGRNERLTRSKVQQNRTQTGGEETCSVSLRPSSTERQQIFVRTCEESSGFCSEESQARVQRKTYVEQDRLQTPLRDSECRRKRAASLWEGNVRCRKLLRRKQLVKSDGYRSDMCKPVNAGPGVVSGKQVNQEEITLATFPSCMRKDHRARLHLSARDVLSLRTELMAHASGTQCASEGIVKTIQDCDRGASCLRSVQFAAFWVRHKAALDERGYTQMHLPTPLLTTATLKLLCHFSYACDRSLGQESRQGPWKQLDFAGRSALLRHKEPLNSLLETIQTWICEDLEDRSLEIYKEKMVIETALAVISEWLGLYRMTNGRPSHEIPPAGYSVLVIPKGFQGQRAYCSFGRDRNDHMTSMSDSSKDPSYMLVVTAEGGLPMRVWRRAHVPLNGPNELLPLTAKNAEAERVFVAPRSVFICRDDLAYAFGECGSKPDAHHIAKRIAVVGYLVKRSGCGKDKQDNNDSWMKHIPILES